MTGNPEAGDFPKYGLRSVMEKLANGTFIGLLHFSANAE